MLKDKAMIIIAVSKYNGDYENLPGVITSARRMREWAVQSDEDCNYKVLYLGDDVYDKIDVNLVRDEISSFVKNNFIDRLVVYFAGHGIVRSAGDQFWLLTDAANDLSEGINVEAFRRGLLKINIGSNQNDLAGQLCIIGDACRSTGRDAIDFNGHSILTSARKMNKSIQLDRFLSTGLGNYSFQINRTDTQNAYCLFSEVMLGALKGDVKEAIQTEYHKFQPVVTNHKLAEYLEKEVRKLAAEMQEEMEPDLLTGIHPDYNFYKKIKKPLSEIKSGSKIQLSEIGVQMAGNDSNERLVKSQARRKRSIIQLKRNIAKDYRYNYHYYDFITLSDFQPRHIAVPQGASIEVVRKEEIFQIEAIGCGYSPILIQQNNQWCVIPNYPNVVSVVSHDLPGDILFLKTGEGVPREQLWDSYLSDFSNLVGNVPLRAINARRFADGIRVGKEEYPHQSVTAGYLYEFSNDYSNIARTAHYMARNTEIVPFDLALLCADRLYWERTPWQQRFYRFSAYADLPKVESNPETDVQEGRPYFALSGFEAKRRVPLLGIAPIFSQGWSFMQTELYLEIPEMIRKVGENITGRSAAIITEKGLKRFLTAFNYRVIEVNS